jgi:hypothetical protein
MHGHVNVKTTSPTQQLCLFHNFRFELRPSTLQPLVVQIVLAAVVFFTVRQRRNSTQTQKDRFCAELITH